MKASVKILMVMALIAGACSSGTHLSTGYDDLYYTPGDEPVVTVTEVTRETAQAREARTGNNAVQQETRYAWEEYGVTPNDTIYFDDFYVVGRDTFAYEQVHHAQEYYADGHVINIHNHYGPEQYYWSTRLRRFHHDHYFYGGYYDPFYTDFYWRSLNRYHFGVSWGWHSPFYSPFHHSPWHRSFYIGYSPWHYRPWGHSYHWGWYGMHYPLYARYAWYPHTYWGHYGYYGYARPVRSVAYDTGHRRGSGSYIGAGRTGGIGGYTPGLGVTDAHGRRTSTTAAPGSRRTDGSGVSSAETGSDRRAAVGTATRPAETGTRAAGTTTRPAGTTTRPAGSTRGTSGRRDEAGTGTESQQQTTMPTYARPIPGDRATYNRSTINYQTRSAPSSERTTTSTASGSSTYTRPASSATYNRPDNRTTGTSGSSVRPAATPPSRPATINRGTSSGTTRRPAVSSGTSTRGGSVSSGTSSGSSGGSRGSGSSGGRR